LPGRTPRDAVEAYARPIQETLSCLTGAILGYAGGSYASSTAHTLCFRNHPVGRLYGTELGLFFSQQYSVIQQSSGEQEWKVQTRGYMYRLDDENGKEIFSYHWHPDHDYPRHPHMHLKSGSGVSRRELWRTHMPTGRVAVESLALYLIDEFGVQSKHEDSRERISRNLEIFERYRSWA
jgi:hypothetical protein